jgi:hypothetical protein
MPHPRVGGGTPAVMADFSEGTEKQANVLELISNGVQYDLWVA